MTLIKSIAIEKPCEQSWQQMTEVNNGRYCGHCCKTVVDFTRMTDAEIINYLSGRNHICGRFNPEQVPGLNRNVLGKTSHFSWKSIIAACSLLIISYDVKAETKGKPSMVQLHAPFKNTGEKIGEDTLKNIVVKGKIIEKGGTFLIPGATIRIKGTAIGTVSDTLGNCTLKVPSVTDVLVISFIGFETKEVYLNRTTENQNYRIEMEAARGGLMGEVVVTKRGNKLHRLWGTIKRLF